MDKERILAISDKCINALILAVVFFVPLYFNPFIVLGFQKTFLFRILVEIIIALSIIKIFAEGKIAFPKKPYFYISIGFIFITQIIATIFSEHIYSAVFGGYWRQMGLFTWMHFFALALIIHNRIITKASTIRDLLYPIFLSGLVMSVYAIIQASGFDFIPWSEAADGIHGRASSLLGQPNFLGTYLLLMIPLSIYLYLSENRFYYKAFFSISALIESVALMLTYSRAAWIGFAFLVFLTVLHYLRQKNRSLSRYAMIGIVIISISFLSLIFLNKSREQISVNEPVSLKKRLVSIVDLKGGSVMMRRLYYGAALEIIKERPYLGHGLDTQLYYFYKHYSPDYAALERINTYPDRAHSEILDILLTTGVLGILSWAVLLFFAIRGLYLFERKGTGGDRRMPFFLLTGVFASSVSAFFGFFTEVSYIFFWLYLGIAFALFEDGQTREISFSVRQNILKFLALTIFLAALFSIWQLNMRPQIADYYYERARNSISKNELNQAIDYFNKAVNASPDQIYYRNRFVIESLPLVFGLTDLVERKEVISYLLDVLLETDADKLTMESRAYMAILLSEIARIDIDSGGNPDSSAEAAAAHKIFNGLTEDSPGMARLHYDHGRLYFYEKRYDESLDEYEKALLLYPDIGRKDINPEHFWHISKEMNLVYKASIESLTAKDRYGEAIKLAEAGLKLDPLDNGLWDRLIKAEIKLGLVDKAEKDFEHLISLHPGNHSLHQGLGNVYAMRGKKDLAERSFERSRELQKIQQGTGSIKQPENNEIEKYYFINHILLAENRLSLMLNVSVFIIILCYVLFAYWEEDSKARKRKIFVFFVSIWMVLYVRTLAIEYGWVKNDMDVYAGKDLAGKYEGVFGEIVRDEDIFRFISWSKSRIESGNKVYIASNQAIVPIFARYYLYPVLMVVDDYRDADFILVYDYKADEFPVKIEMVDSFKEDKGSYKISL